MTRWRAAFWIGAILIGAAAILVVISEHRSNPGQESYPTTNYSEIEDGLFVGGILSKPPKGVRAVLNVCETKDPYVAEVHRWQPIPDLGPAPELAWLRGQVEFVDQQRKAGLPVFVHCRAGVNRSVTVVAAYLMWRDHLSRDDALEKIRAKRSVAGPYDVYKDYLKDWEKSIN
jgi:hypothetical protein